jgi:hypothetical protein
VSKCDAELKARHDEQGRERVSVQATEPLPTESAPAPENGQEHEAPGAPAAPASRATGLTATGSEQAGDPTADSDDLAAPAPGDGFDLEGAGATPPHELKKHRLAILKAFQREKALADMEALGRRVGASRTQLYGMARGDTSRYSADKLDLVLRKINCPRQQWDNLPSPSRHL